MEWAKTIRVYAARFEDTGALVDDFLLDLSSSWYFGSTEAGKTWSSFTFDDALKSVTTVFVPCFALHWVTLLGEGLLLTRGVWCRVNVGGKLFIGLIGVSLFLSRSLQCWWCVIMVGTCALGHVHGCSLVRPRLWIRVMAWWWPRRVTMRLLKSILTWWWLSWLTLGAWAFVSTHTTSWVFSIWSWVIWCHWVLIVGIKVTILAISGRKWHSHTWHHSEWERIKLVRVLAIRTGVVVADRSWEIASRRHHVLSMTSAVFQAAVALAIRW